LGAVESGIRRDQSADLFERFAGEHPTTVADGRMGGLGTHVNPDFPDGLIVMA